MDDFFKRMDFAERMLIEVCEDAEILPEIPPEVLRKGFTKPFIKWYIQKKCSYRLIGYRIENKRDRMT